MDQQGAAQSLSAQVDLIALQTGSALSVPSPGVLALQPSPPHRAVQLKHEPGVRWSLRSHTITMARLSTLHLHIAANAPYRKRDSPYPSPSTSSSSS